MRWALLVVVGALAAVLAGAYWYLAQHRPLAIGGMVAGAMRYEDGGEPFYAIQLVNEGRLPVRVTDINLESDGTPLLLRTEARIGFTSTGDRSATRPFEPFTLGYRESRAVTVFGRFDNCEHYAAGSGTRRELQLVGYRVLWVVPAEQEVALSSPIVVRSPPDDACRDRE